MAVIVKAGLAMSLASLLASTAMAQDVIMRRPLPKENGVGTPTPSPTPTPGSTPTPTPEETPTPTPTPDVVTPVEEDPVTTVCDSATSEEATLSQVQWIEAGWTAPKPGADSCETQTMQYTCQATYTCDVDGERRSFVSEAPDATCENFPGEVASPPTSYPQHDIDAQAQWVAHRLAAIAGSGTRPTSDWQVPAGTQMLRSSSWVRTDMIFYYDHWKTDGWALRVYFNDTPGGPFCTAFKKYSGKTCDNYGSWGTWVYYK